MSLPSEQPDNTDDARIVDGDLNSQQTTNDDNGNIPVHQEPAAFEVPEGFDADLFDTEKGVLLPEKVKEKIETIKKSEEQYKNQAEHYRKVISKGVKMPETAEEYAKDYKAPEEYGFLYSEESDPETKEFLEANLSAVDELSLEQGLSKTQNEAIKNKLHQLLVDAGVIEKPLTSEEKALQEAENKKWIEEQYKSLGGVENVRKVISHYQNFNVLNEAEREAVMKHMDGDPVLISAMNKLRIYTHGEEAGSDIPVTPSIGGLADDNTLAHEYNNPQTTDARRMEILQQRINAGRTGKLPLVGI